MPSPITSLPILPPTLRCSQEHCDQTRILARFPRAGRKVPEFDDENVRELIVYSYRIIYRLQNDEALIVAVIHGKRILQ